MCIHCFCRDIFAPSRAVRAFIKRVVLPLCLAFGNRNSRISLWSVDRLRPPSPPQPYPVYFDRIFVFSFSLSRTPFHVACPVRARRAANASEHGSVRRRLMRYVRVVVCTLYRRRSPVHAARSQITRTTRHATPTRYLNFFPSSRVYYAFCCASGACRKPQN